jgi:hypothetical protein
MSLGELRTTLQNLEGTGAERGQASGPNRRVLCRMEDGVDDLYMAEVRIEGGTVVLVLSGDEQ